MRKSSNKNTSRQKSKEVISTEIAYRPYIIQTESGSQRKNTLRQHKYFSGLREIEQLKLVKKYTAKEIQRKRRPSNMSNRSSRCSESKSKVLKHGEQQFYQTTTNQFNFMKTNNTVIDNILTQRNKQKLPTNIAGQLTALKNHPIQTSFSLVQQQKNNKKGLKQLKVWDESKKPYNTLTVLKTYSHYLLDHQKSQILQYNHIYYLGHKLEKKNSIKSPIFENQQSQYVYTLSDHVAYRYQILRLLGKGSFGQVFLVFDHKKNQQMALKIIKNKKKHTKQAQIQINILTTIKQLDPYGHAGIVQVQNTFIFRKHQCIVFQLLNSNLYEVIKSNNHGGLDLQLIKKFSIQILNSLCFLKQNRIIHCDLKPENILLVQANKQKVKLIDFGSSCFNNQIIYEYIQSRYYRAPQITLGLPYNDKIDMWSFACILVELYTGKPLFPGSNEQEQMACMILTLGMPSQNMMKASKRRRQFFHEDFSLRSQVKNQKIKQNMGKKLKQIINDQPFLDFLSRILKWNPQQRITPREALLDKWILDDSVQQSKYLNINNQNTPNKTIVRTKDSAVKDFQKKYRRALGLSSKPESIDLKQIQSKPNTGRKQKSNYFGFRHKQLSSQK